MSDQHFNLAREAISPALARARDLPEVTDEDTAEQATEIAASLARALKEAEAQRKAAAEPLLEAKRKLDVAFKELVSPATAALQAVKDRILAYNRAKAEAVAAEQRRLEENARRRQAREDARAAEEKREARQHAAPELAPPVPSQRKTEVGSTVSRMVWRFEVVNDAELPRPYLKVDEQAIRTAVRNGVRQIPGVRIYQDERLAVRA